MSKRKFTREFKESAAKLVSEQGYTFAEAAKSLGVDPGSIRGWVKMSPADFRRSSLRHVRTSTHPGICCAWQVPKDRRSEPRHYCEHIVSNSADICSSPSNRKLAQSFTWKEVAFDQRRSKKHRTRVATRVLTSLKLLIHNDLRIVEWRRRELNAAQTLPAAIQANNLRQRLIPCQHIVSIAAAAHVLTCHRLTPGYDPSLPPGRRFPPTFDARWRRCASNPHRVTILEIQVSC